MRRMMSVCGTMRNGECLAKPPLKLGLTFTVFVRPAPQ